MNAVELATAERGSVTLTAEEAYEAAERAAIETEPTAAECDGWAEPVGFDALEAGPFPIDTLPPVLATWAREEATALQVPIDLPALLALAVVSLCGTKKIVVEIKEGWREPTNLYVAIALAPGEGKSPAFADAIRPVREWEQEERRRLAPQIADVQEQRRLLEARANELRKRAARGSGPANDRAEEQARELAVAFDALRVPASPRLVADDATTEAVGRLLAEQGGRLGLFSSEGGGPFAIMAGRYSEGRANFELFLKAHSGDAYDIDRVNRPSLHIGMPLLTIALTVQPAVIAGLASTPGFRGLGLLARFVYAVPRSIVGSREADPPPMATDTRESYERAIRDLLSLPFVADDEGEIRPAVLRLANDARAALIAFKAELEPHLGPEGDMHALADWGNKLTGAVARIAGLLHIADGLGRALGTPIEAEKVHRAIRIAEYAVEHARVAFGLMSADPATALAKRILALVRRIRGNLVTRREVQRALHAERAAELDAGLALLVERGYLRKVVTPPTGGRPAGPTFEINPRWRR